MDLRIWQRRLAPESGIVLALNYEAGFALMDLRHHVAQRSAKSM